MLWLRTRRKWLLLTLAAILLAVVPLHLAGDETPSRAMLFGLERRYGAGREHRPVYIEGSHRMLEKMSAIGRQPVEVVSRAELVTRYAGSEVAPELTTVTVAEQHGAMGVRYSVTVSSFGYRVPGATAIPRGGTRIYHFRQWAGFLWADGEDFIAH